MRPQIFSKGRLPLAAAVFFIAILLTVPAPAQAPIPDASRVELMVKSTLVALNHANMTGNYTVLRDLGSPRFRANNTAARLAAVFAPMRERDLDLSPVLVFEPVLTQPVSSDEQGRLRLVGYFPTRPLRVFFDLAYEPVQSRWMISDIAVDFSPSPEQAGPDNGESERAPADREGAE